MARYGALDNSQVLLHEALYFDWTKQAFHLLLSCFSQEAYIVSYIVAPDKAEKIHVCFNIIKITFKYVNIISHNRSMTKTKQTKTPKTNKTKQH